MSDVLTRMMDLQFMLMSADTQTITTMAATGRQRTGLAMLISPKKMEPLIYIISIPDMGTGN